MHLHRNLLRMLLAMACILFSTAAFADVVVDMPAPPRTTRAAEEVKTPPPTDQATGTATGSPVQPSPDAARPTVGQIALARYARARRRPHDTYYISRYSRFGGYYWPYYYHYWGPYNLDGWNYFWPAWTWGHWSFTVNCKENNSGSSGSSGSGSGSSSSTSGAASSSSL